MKTESMAQFLIKGDQILYNRKKYEVVNVKTVNRKTTIFYSTAKTNVVRMIEVDCNEFFKVISPVSYSK